MRRKIFIVGNEEICYNEFIKMKEGKIIWKHINISA